MDHVEEESFVIGGGAAGHGIAYRLQDVANVVLVDPKTYWEIPTAVPRLLVDSDSLNARIAYAGMLKNARHVQGRAIAIADGTARIALNVGKDIDLNFDFAVLATGSAYLDQLIKAEALTEDMRATEIRAMHRRLSNAHGAVVVGGGPVGVETAAELRETFPGLAVTLVHAGSTLLDHAPSHFPEWGLRALKERGVALVLNDRVMTPSIGTQPDSGMVKTEKGLTIPAEAVIWAAGAKARTGFIVCRAVTKPSTGASALC